MMVEGDGKSMRCIACFWFFGVFGGWGRSDGMGWDGGDAAR